MPLANFTRLAQEQPLRVLLVNAGDADTLTWAGLVQPLRLAAKLLGPGRLQIDVRTPQSMDGEVHAPTSASTPTCASTSTSTSTPTSAPTPARAPANAHARTPAREAAHLVLLVADEAQAAHKPANWRALIDTCRAAPCWGGVGAGVLWLADAGALNGVRCALPWALYADVDTLADHAVFTPHLYEIDGAHLSCCGGAASVDFAVFMVETLFGAAIAAQLKETLCIDRVRGQDERQRVALQARFGALQPKLTEAVSLMEANIEEPLSTDDIANLVGLSRRQLERLFKQYLGSLPSRYYLELRLQRARQLLQGTNNSIVQVGLMCGFSSGSHFSTAFGTLFGNTPREERQRKLSAAAPAAPAAPTAADVATRGVAPPDQK